jgi:hypothetical protein
MGICAALNFCYGGLDMEIPVMKLPIPLLALLALLALSACATITASHEQEIEVVTTPAGAACVLENTTQQWLIEETPGSVSVPRAFEPLLLTCRLAGYAPKHVTIEAKTRGRAYGNILLLGIPALVDTATGAGYEYSPDHLELTLERAAP